MNLLPWRRKPEVLERDFSQAIPFQEFVDWLQYQGTFYPFSSLNQTLRNDREEIGSGFSGLTSAYMSNSVVFACMEVRRSHFSEAQFVFREIRDGLPGDLTGRPSTYLEILRNPWPGGSAADLLSRMIQDVDLAGNCYIVRDRDRLARLRPDWTAIVLGSRTRRESFVPGDPDTEIAGYLYFPGGKASGETPLTFLPEQVAHFAPIPDPFASYMGMSWLTSLIREVQADTMMTTHKQKFLENGATPNMIVKFPQGVTRDNFNEAVATIKAGHEGIHNAHKTLFLSGGADATVVGSSFQETDFKSVQGAGETRIAAAAGTPPVIVGLSEGLAGSSLNAGNYQSSRRRFADGTMRPLWRKACGSLSRIITVPGNAELWYDERDVAFLKEDLKDIAEVQQMQMIAAKSGIDAGWQPDAVIAYLASDDLSRLLGKHSGLTSVQLQPMDGKQNENGNGNGILNGKGTVIPSGVKNGNG